MLATKNTIIDQSHERSGNVLKKNCINLPVCVLGKLEIECGLMLELCSVWNCCLAHDTQGLLEVSQLSVSTVLACIECLHKPNTVLMYIWPCEYWIKTDKNVNLTFKYPNGHCVCSSFLLPNASTIARTQFISLNGCDCMAIDKSCFSSKFWSRKDDFPRLRKHTHTLMSKSRTKCVSLILGHFLGWFPSPRHLINKGPERENGDLLRTSKAELSIHGTGCTADLIPPNSLLWPEVGFKSVLSVIRTGSQRRWWWHLRSEFCGPVAIGHNTSRVNLSCLSNQQFKFN